MKANEASPLKLQSILALYEDISGQMLNKEKSTVMFSKQTTQAAKRKFKRLLQISDEAFNERYLGLPIHLGRSKNKAFGYLRPCFAQVVHVGLLSIIPRGFGGNTSDTQSPFFLYDPLPPNIRTQNYHFAWRGHCRPDAREEGDRCNQNAKTRGWGSVSFPPVPTCFRVDQWGWPTQNRHAKQPPRVSGVCCGSWLGRDETHYTLSKRCYKMRPKGKGLEKDPRVEREISFKGWEGDLGKGGCANDDPQV
jgi:hypothetical protein